MHNCWSNHLRPKGGRLQAVQNQADVDDRDRRLQHRSGTVQELGASCNCCQARHADAAAAGHCGAGGRQHITVRSALLEQLPREVHLRMQSARHVPQLFATASHFSAANVRAPQPTRAQPPGQHRGCARNKGQGAALAAGGHASTLPALGQRSHDQGGEAAGAAVRLLRGRRAAGAAAANDGAGRAPLAGGGPRPRIGGPPWRWCHSGRCRCRN